MKEFEKLLRETSLSEKEICIILYGNDRKTNTYRSLKFRLEEHLLNDVFMLSGNLYHDNNYSFNSIIASKNYTIASTLHKHGFINEAIMLFKKNQIYCEKKSITNIAVINIKQLYYHYAFVIPNKRIMEEALNKSEKLLKIFIAEKELEKYNSIISNLYVTKKGGFSKLDLIEMKNIIDKITQIKNQHHSRTIKLLAYDLLCFYHIQINDYEKCIKLAYEGMQESPIFEDDRQFINSCIINIAIANFHLCNYNESQVWFLKGIESSPKGSRTWFHHCAKYFTVLLRLKNYEKIIELYNSVTNDKNLKKFPSIREEWEIRGAIIFFFLQADLCLPHNLSSLPLFSVNKFINSVPFYNKDKTGQYVTIQIIKILFLLLNSKFDKIIDLADSLTQYTYKYLKKDETFRSNCFIKMILKMVKAGFHPSLTNIYIKDLKAKLYASKINFGDHVNEVEIIPYEDLWEIIDFIIKKSS